MNRPLAAVVLCWNLRFFFSRRIAAKYFKMKPLKGPGGVFLFLLTCIILLTGIFGTYALAFWRGNVKAAFSLISDAGGTPPQSGLLTLCIFVSSISGVIFLFIRHQVVEEQNAKGKRIIRFLNNAASICGISGGVGFLIAVSFPLGDQRDFEDFLVLVLAPHMFGVYLGILGISGYLLLHLVISFRLGIASWKILAVRAFLAFNIVVFVLFVLYSIPAAMPWITGHHNYTGKCSERKALGMYTVAYEPSAFGQWLVILLFMASGLTYIGEVKGYYFEFQVQNDEKGKALSRENST